MYKADEGVLTSSSLTETESERGLFRLREPERRAREIRTVDLTEKAGSDGWLRFLLESLTKRYYNNRSQGRGSCTRSTNKTVEA